MNEQTKPRDGVIEANGLTADFRFVRSLKSCEGMVVIETATGTEQYVSARMLNWDHEPRITL